MITLRPFTRDDFERLRGWIPSAELLMLWGGPKFSYPLDEAQLDAHLNSASTAPPSALIFTAVESETMEAIGHIEISDIDRQNRSAAVTRVLVGESAQRGQGIGKAMVHEALHVAFDELKLHRVSLHVFDFNDEAIRCYESVGFKREGLHRDARAFGNEFWSVLTMSILENEWKSVSEKYFPTLRK